MSAATLAPQQRRAFVEQIMGMPISIHVRAADLRRPDIEAAAERAFAHLRKVDAVLSTWRADSDLLRLQHGELLPGADETHVEMHHWVADTTDLCLEAEDLTDGLFRAWRPSPAGRLVFDPTGLVKGWAVVGAAQHLALVDGIAWSIGAGGDIAVGVGRGMGGVEPVWRIGLEDPRQRGAIAEVVSMTTGGIATSGAAVRGAHIQDPVTGRGIRRAGSTTVIGPDLTRADVWATAAFVDPERAGALIAERDPEYRLIVL